MFVFFQIIIIIVLNINIKITISSQLRKPFLCSLMSSKVSNFVEKMKSTLTIDRAPDGALTSLGEPGSIKMTRNTSQENANGSRTIDPHMSSSYLNITSTHPDNSIDTPPTPHKHPDRHSPPVASATSPVSAPDNSLLMSVKLQQRQIEVMEYIANAHVLIWNASPIASLYRSMPQVDALVLIKQCWPQIKEHFPEVQKCITDPEGTDIHSLMIPVHDFVFENYYQGRVSPIRNGPSPQPGHKRGLDISSEGSYTKSTKLRAGNDGDNCPRPIDPKFDISRSDKENSATENAPPSGPNLTSTPNNTGCKKSEDLRTKFIHQSERLRGKTEEHTTDMDRLNNINLMLDEVDDLCDRNTGNSSSEDHHTNSEDIEQSLYRDIGYYAVLTHEELNSSIIKLNNLDTAPVKNAKKKTNKKRELSSTDSEGVTQPEKFQKDEEDLPTIKTATRRQRKNYRRTLRTEAKSKMNKGKGVSANHTPQKTKVPQTLIPITVSSETEISPSQANTAMIQPNYPNKNHASDPTNQIRSKGQISEAGASVSTTVDQDTTSIPGKLHIDEDMDTSEWKTVGSRRKNTSKTNSSIEPPQSDAKPSAPQPSKPATPPNNSTKKFELPAFHFPKGINRPKDFLYQISLENPEIKPSHISFTNTVRCGSIILPQNISTANRLKFPVLFRGQYIALNQIGAEKWTPHTVIVRNLDKQEAINSQHIYNHSGVLQVKLQPCTYTAQHKRPKYNLVIKYKTKEVVPPFIPINGILHSTTNGVDTPNKQCYKCQKFGHIQFNCKSPTTKCAVCAGDHLSKECREKIKNGMEVNIKCANCGQNHLATAKTCRHHPAANKPQQGTRESNKKIPALLDLNLEHTEAARMHRASMGVIFDNTEHAQHKTHGIDISASCSKAIDQNKQSRLIFDHDPDNKWTGDLRKTMTVLKYMRKCHPQVSLAIENVASKLSGSSGRAYVLGRPLNSSATNNLRQTNNGRRTLLPTPAPSFRIG